MLIKQHILMVIKEVNFDENDNYTITSFTFSEYSTKINQTYANNADGLQLICANGKTISISVYADCCSEGWLEFDSLENCVGKKIKSIYENGKLELTSSGVQDCDINTRVYIDFSDNSHFLFVHRNSSNGYYSNSLDINIV